MESCPLTSRHAADARTTGARWRNDPYARPTCTHAACSICDAWRAAAAAAAAEAARAATTLGQPGTADARLTAPWPIGSDFEADATSDASLLRHTHQVLHQRPNLVDGVAGPVPLGVDDHDNNFLQPRPIGLTRRNDPYARWLCMDPSRARGWQPYTAGLTGRFSHPTAPRPVGWEAGDDERLASAKLPALPGLALLCAGGGDVAAWGALPPLRHSPLLGRVRFVSYVQLLELAARRGDGASTANERREAAGADGGGAARPALARMFAGQLPYGGADAMLRLLLTGVGGFEVDGAAEMMQKNHSRKRRVPNGCVSFVMAERSAAAAMAAFDQRVLMDQDGVWIAETVQQQRVLVMYAAELRARVGPNPPYAVNLVTVERSTSTWQSEREARWTAAVSDAA